MQVSAPLVAQRPPWLRVSQRIAGVCENYCPILCRRLVGPHPSSVGVPHIGVNALLSAGAAITVRGGATRPGVSQNKAKGDKRMNFLAYRVTNKPQSSGVYLISACG